MPVKRWAAILKDGSIVGVGATPSKFEFRRIVFVDGWMKEWVKQRSRFTRLIDGSFAKILRNGPKKENINVYKHRRIRRYRGRVKRHEQEERTD